MEKADKIRVLLVDDQKLFVESLRYVLESRAPDIEVIGIASDGAAAVEAVRRHRPDIILMDVRMPGMDGVQATRVIHEQHPEIRILMLSTFADDGYVRQAIDHGAIGYLIKNLAPAEVIKSIRAVRSGIMQIDPSVAKALLAKDTGEPQVPPEPLTRREREVLGLILKSYDNREIAAYLTVGEQTARNYVHNLYSKLGVSNRMQLVRVLREAGLPAEGDADGPAGAPPGR
jgi:DNA-binding NarL/FixJ family response regulator